MNHLFITVGTSQLTNEHLGLPADVQADLTCVCEARTRVKNEAHIIERLSPLLIQKLAEYWADLPDTTPCLEGNCFGAELTTLLFVILKPWMEASDKKVCAFQQQLLESVKADRFYLHVSDTSAGRLSGRVLSDFLRDVWAVPTGSIHLYHADKLDQNPLTAGDAKIALESFASQFAESMIHSAATRNPQPTRHILISGGFKALVPTLDRFSLAYDIPLSYLFEEAPAPVYGDKLNLRTEIREEIKELLKRQYPGAKLPPLQNF